MRQPPTPQIKMWLVYWEENTFSCYEIMRWLIHWEDSTFFVLWYRNVLIFLRRLHFFVLWCQNVINWLRRQQHWSQLPQKRVKTNQKQNKRPNESFNTMIRRSTLNLRLWLLCWWVFPLTCCDHTPWCLALSFHLRMLLLGICFFITWQNFAERPHEFILW